MEEIVAAIGELYKLFARKEAGRIEKLPQSGSDRVYFRIYGGDQNYIATFNLNIRENETFIYFSEHFKTAGLPMPQIYAISDDKTIYIQEDLGTESLLDKLEQHGYTDYTYNLYQKTLKALAKVQIEGHGKMNYEMCLTAKEFGKQAIMSDLLYFKYYFFDTLKTALR